MVYPQIRMVGLRANTESALSRLIYPSDLTLLLQAERDIVIEYRYLNVKNLTNHLKKISIWIGIAKLFCFSGYKSINRSIKNIKSIKNINALNDQGINHILVQVKLHTFHQPVICPNFHLGNFGSCRYVKAIFMSIADVLFRTDHLLTPVLVCKG